MIYIYILHIYIYILIICYIECYAESVTIYTSCYINCNNYTYIIYQVEDVEHVYLVTGEIIGVFILVNDKNLSDNIYF